MRKKWRQVGRVLFLVQITVFGVLVLELVIVVVVRIKRGLKEQLFGVFDGGELASAHLAFF